MSIIYSDSAPVDAVMQAGFYGDDVALIAVSVCVAYIGLTIALYLLVIRDWKQYDFTITIVTYEVAIKVDTKAGFLSPQFYLFSSCFRREEGMKEQHYVVERGNFNLPKLF